MFLNFSEAVQRCFQAAARIAAARGATFSTQDVVMALLSSHDLSQIHLKESSHLRLASLLTDLSDRSLVTVFELIELASTIAKRHGASHVDLSHLLLALLDESNWGDTEEAAKNERECLANELIRQMGPSEFSFDDALDRFSNLLPIKNLLEQLDVLQDQKIASIEANDFATAKAKKVESYRVRDVLWHELKLLWDRTEGDE
jgi:ATP-dependent Clp protease ATP-binding subunit ClpA